VKSETREKLREASRRRAMARRSPSQVFADNPRAWWNTRAISQPEIAYAVQIGYEVGYAAALSSLPPAPAAKAEKPLTPGDGARRSDGE
jgi:hypothetical protein